MDTLLRYCLLRLMERRKEGWCIRFRTHVGSVFSYQFLFAPRDCHRHGKAQVEQSQRFLETDLILCSYNLLEVLLALFNHLVVEVVQSMLEY